MADIGLIVDGLDAVGFYQPLTGSYGVAVKILSPEHAQFGDAERLDRMGFSAVEFGYGNLLRFSLDSRLVILDIENGWESLQGHIPPQKLLVNTSNQDIRAQATDKKHRTIPFQHQKNYEAVKSAIDSILGTGQ